MQRCLVLTNPDPARPLLTIDLGVLTCNNAKGYRRDAEVEHLDWMDDQSVHQDNNGRPMGALYEIALKPGARDFLKSLHDKGCQLAAITDHRHGDACEMQDNFTMLGIADYFLAYVSMPVADPRSVEPDPRMDGELSKLTAKRALLVGEFGPGGVLLELAALGLITWQQARAWTNLNTQTSGIRQHPQVMQALEQVYAPAFISLRKQEPLVEQWNRALQIVLAKL